MSDATIRSSLTWSLVDLSGGPAHGTLPLRIGTVGDAGPLVTITCGIHGDEGPWSALAVQRVLERPRADLRGRLRIVLAANPGAVAANARCAPFDGLDLNHLFPGKPQGSHSERLAAALADVADGSDVLVDLHGGGSWCMNAFAFRFPGSEDLADAVGAPFVVDAPLRSGHLAGFAAERGTRVVAIEMGGRGAAEGAWCARLADGIDRVLALAGAVTARLAAPAAARAVTDLAVVRPAVGGVLVPTLTEDAVGIVVDGDTELGTVRDLGTMEPVETLRAPYDRTAMLLVRPHVAVVEGGAMAYVVARVSGPLSATQP